MKKTIITLLTLAGVAVAGTTLPENGTEITYTSDLSTGSANGGSYKGVIFTLNPVNDTNRFDYNLASKYTMPSVLELTSITITGRAQNLNDDQTVKDNFSASNLQMVVVDDSTKKIVGISNGTAQSFDTATDAVNRDMEFTFDNVYLTTTATSTTNSKWYRAFFVSGTTAANLTLRSTLADSDFASTPLMAYGSGYSTSNNGGGADWGFVQALSGAVASSAYVPVMTIKTKAVPEPTTAMLSLLALAGLAARRRR